MKTLSSHFSCYSIVFHTLLACFLFHGLLVYHPLSAQEQTDEGVILAWNNIFPNNEVTAEWYEEVAGFTGAYLSAPYLTNSLGNDLVFGLRLYPGRSNMCAAPCPSGSRYQIKTDRYVMNPYHEIALETYLAYLDEQFAPLLPESAQNIRFVLLDSEGIIAPPCTIIEGTEQEAAISIVTQAAVDAGVLAPGEEFPLTVYGMVPVENSSYNEDKEILSDLAQYRVLDWWFNDGAGPGRVWNAVIDKVRQYLPDVYITADPISGVDARPVIPAFSAANSGLDFVQNWIYVTGFADRIPIYAAHLVNAAKASGLPVVQGPQLFCRNSSTTPYPHDLIYTANLLTLIFNPRNGASPEVPWGIVHWGFRPLTYDATVDDLAPYHGDAAEELIANRETNQAEILPAIQSTRQFLVDHAGLLNECEDIPAKVGVIATKGGAYFSLGSEWYTYYHRISEWPYALLMAHVPYQWISEDDDFSPYTLLILPDYSYPTDILVEKLTQWGGAVTGDMVSEAIQQKIPGWVDPPSIAEVGNWPWGNQHEYPLGGHFYELEADQIRAWLLDRASTYGTFLASILGPPDVETDPEVIVNRLQWNDRQFLFAVNTRMETGDNACIMKYSVPLTTTLRVRGNWENGVYDPETQMTSFPLSFEGSGYQYLELVPAGKLRTTGYLFGYWTGTEYRPAEIEIILTGPDSSVSFPMTLNEEGIGEADLSSITPGDYIVELIHENHINVRTLLPKTWDGVHSIEVDFSDPATVACGLDALIEESETFRQCIPAGDATGDGLVDIFDYLDLGRNWNISDPASDYNGDQIVDILDYLLFAQTWGCAECPVEI